MGDSIIEVCAEPAVSLFDDVLISVDDSATVAPDVNALSQAFAIFRESAKEHSRTEIARVSSLHALNAVSIPALRNALKPFAHDKIAFDALVRNMMTILRSDIDLLVKQLSPNEEDRSLQMKVIQGLSRFASDAEVSLKQLRKSEFTFLYLQWSCFLYIVRSTHLQI